MQKFEWAWSERPVTPASQALQHHETSEQTSLPTLLSVVVINACFRRDRFNFILADYARRAIKPVARPNTRDMTSLTGFHVGHLDVFIC